tara:strand:+ start:67839 stop:68264 length:426 start_codon:yes stop_codon:yes gene_type:complete
MNSKIVKLFLRFSLAAGFLSAVADRFGLWPADISVWGTMDNFFAYTELINPIVPKSLISPLGIIATGAEVIFGVLLIIGFKTELIAKLSGYLLLLFACAMTFSTGVKGAFDYSVFVASAAAFALSHMNQKYFEVDLLLSKS